MNIFIYTEQALKDLVQNTTATQEIRNAFINSVIDPEHHRLTQFFYNVFTEYSGAYVDLMDSCLSYPEICNDYAAFDRLQSRLNFEQSKICIASPVDILYADHCFDSIDPCLYDDLGNLLYMQHKDKGTDMVDDVSRLIKTVVSHMESYYIYKKTDNTPIRVIVGYHPGQLCLCVD